MPAADEKPPVDIDLALRQAQERAALAARGAGLGTWQLDLASGESTWDDQMWLLRGLPAISTRAPSSAEQLLIVHPQDREAVRENVQRAIESQQATQYEFRIVRPDGQVRWLASRSSPVFDSQGRPLQRIGVNWDITDAREADQVRQQRELALRESHIKSLFMARMSHELRTPLNAILGLSGLLIDDATSPLSALQHERLQHLRDAGQQLLALVDGVLELSQAEAPALAEAIARPMPPAPTLRAVVRGTLLYIEDNAVNALIVQELVQRRPGLVLHVAATGTEGVERAVALQPDVVLLDMQLPDIDGFEVLRRLRGQGSLRHTPVVALSANAMPADIDAAMAAGLAAYWTKPLDFDVFDAWMDQRFGPR